jgi:4-amino-4-deoxy-L-arabinose transferase-like glycosyltransferase
VDEPEDDHFDGRARFAVGCGVLSLLVFVSFAIGILFAAPALTFAGASVIAVDDPASPRTRRAALIAALLTLPALIALVLRLRSPGQSSE